MSLRDRILLLLLALGAPGARWESPAHAQAPASWYRAASVGIGYQPDRRGDHLSPVGAHLHTTMGWWALPRLAAELGAGATYFAETSNHVHGPCHPDEPPAECHLPVGAIGVATLGGSLAWAAGPRPRSLQLRAGAGLHALFAHPSDPGSVRLGVHAGAGLPLHVLAPLTLEVHYHRVLDSGASPRWFVPVAVRFPFGTLTPRRGTPPSPGSPAPSHRPAPSGSRPGCAPREAPAPTRPAPR